MLGGRAAWEIVRGNGSRAFGWVIALLLASLTFRFGDDTGHHVYRIAVLAEQLRRGMPSLLVTNPVSGEVLPIFVYYSFVPYLPAVALDLAGFTAHVAFRLVMGLSLIVLALGLVRLIPRPRPRGACGVPGRDPLPVRQLRLQSLAVAPGLCRDLGLLPHPVGDPDP